MSLIPFFSTTLFVSPKWQMHAANLIRPTKKEKICKELKHPPPYCLLLRGAVKASLVRANKKNFHNYPDGDNDLLSKGFCNQAGCRGQKMKLPPQRVLSFSMRNIFGRNFCWRLL